MGKHKRHNSRSRSRERDSHRSRSRERDSHRRDRDVRSDDRDAGRNRSRYDRNRKAGYSERDRKDTYSDRGRGQDRKQTKTSRRSRSREKRKKSKKSRKRSSSDSDSYNSDDSISSNDSAVLIAKLELKKMEEKERFKLEKERRKANETPEEKRARRLMKKHIKGTKAKEKMGWDDEMDKYDNDDNPFGDSSLTQPFRWNKKLEKEGIGNIKDEELEQLAKLRVMEQRQELEKVKKSRLERERERQERTDLEELEQRSRETEKFAKWQKDEDTFHLKQALLRSSIRITDGRAKPIDLLAKYISKDDDDGVDAVEMHEPYTYLNGLTTTDLEDLLEDIKVYVRLEKDQNIEYWRDITVIVEDELHKLRKLDSQTGSMYEAAVERREGINKAVGSDVQAVFKGKSVEQLVDLQAMIEGKLSERAEGLDISYWESLLSQLKAHTARARLRDQHQKNLRSKLELLKAEQGVASEDKREAGEAHKEEVNDDTIMEVDEPEAGSSQGGPDDDDEDDDDEIEEWEVELNGCITEYKSGHYSPQYIPLDELQPATITFLEEEDKARRNFDQQKALKGSQVENVLNSEEKALEREAKKGMGNDEVKFSVESALDQTYEWSDKYRPRKPRYFNRVHTGFEWNKYNQTHYDFDNPPPKIVQGYKFNIFYPDLIEKSATPEFKMIPTQDGDFCILHINAGPPYEDIAFKIVNKEWEYGYKRGFRCQFHNNIFQLWFHFKRYRYRR